MQYFTNYVHLIIMEIVCSFSAADDKVCTDTFLSLSLPSLLFEGWWKASVLGVLMFLQIQAHKLNRIFPPRSLVKKVTEWGFTHLQSCLSSIKKDFLLKTKKDINNECLWFIKSSRTWFQFFDNESQISKIKIMFILLLVNRKFFISLFVSYNIAAKEYMYLNCETYLVV